MKDKCQCCNTGLNPEEIYGDWFYCAVCHRNFPYQPERLNPEGHFREAAYDSPNMENKENP
jgi:hypothetical protein